MKVVLTKDQKNLGYRGEVVNVKNGYFRNFLRPNGLAEVATAARIKLADMRKEKMVMAKQQLLDSANEVLEKLAGLKVKVAAKVADGGKLYGSITETEIVEAVEAAAKVRLEKEFLKMEHLKEVGEHEVLVHLGPDLEQAITVVVEPLKA